MKRVSFFIDEEQDEALRDLATAQGISAAELIRRAIERLLLGSIASKVETLEQEVKSLKERVEELEK